MGGAKITRKTLRLPSPVDGLSLAVEKMEPAGGIRGIVQISHGMAEHKERYEDFMTFLAENGYLCVIHDHRGHGGSVRRPEDLGYFYTEDPAALAEDLYAVTAMIRAKHPQVPLYLFSHSMGTLVARSYLKRHDRALSGLVLCGKPIHEVFAAVPPACYLDSILADIGPDATLDSDPAYTLLNLCRTWAYLDDGLVRSKLQGGHWALSRLSKDQSECIRAALAHYEGRCATFPPRHALQSCAAWLLTQVRKNLPVYTSP